MIVEMAHKSKTLTRSTSGRVFVIRDIYRACIIFYTKRRLVMCDMWR